MIETELKHVIALTKPLLLQTQSMKQGASVSARPRKRKEWWTAYRQRKARAMEEEVLSLLALLVQMYKY